jgi:hypothetical protein
MADLECLMMFLHNLRIVLDKLNRAFLHQSNHLYSFGCEFVDSEQNQITLKLLLKDQAKAI